MWFYGHGGKPVWHNYRESFQLHWCNLCVICQWLRYSITSQAHTSAPHHKSKINKKKKKKPTQLSFHYLIERGRWTFKYKRGCLSLHPMHDDLNIYVYDEDCPGHFVQLQNDKNTTCLDEEQVSTVTWPPQSFSHHMFLSVSRIWYLALMLSHDSNR